MFILLLYFLSLLNNIIIIFFVIISRSYFFFFFFLNDPAPPEISPLPLPAPLPIGAQRDRAWRRGQAGTLPGLEGCPVVLRGHGAQHQVAVHRQSKQRRTDSDRRQLRSEEHTSELQSQSNLVCRLLLEKKKTERMRKDGASSRFHSITCLIAPAAHTCGSSSSAELSRKR